MVCILSHPIRITANKDTESAMLSKFMVDRQHLKVIIRKRVKKIRRDDQAIRKQLSLCSSSGFQEVGVMPEISQYQEYKIGG